MTDMEVLSERIKKVFLAPLNFGRTFWGAGHGKKVYFSQKKCFACSWDLKGCKRVPFVFVLSQIGVNLSGIIT